MADLEHIFSILPRTDIAAKLKKWIYENMTIICDTREKENTHITGYFKQIGGKYVFDSLKTGDYACMLCGKPFNGLVIERKNSLTELSANITKHRERFENELERAKNSNTRMILLIEDDDYNNLFEHTYKTDTSTNSFLATLFTYQERYNIDIVSIKTRHVGRFIYNRFYYHVRETLKCKNDFDEKYTSVYTDIRDLHKKHYKAMSERDWHTLIDDMTEIIRKHNNSALIVNQLTGIVAEIERVNFPPKQEG